MFSKNSFRITIKVLNNWDPDQARHLVVPDLGPNCFTVYQQLSPAGKGLVYMVTEAVFSFWFVKSLFLYWTQGYKLFSC